MCVCVCACVCVCVCVAQARTCAFNVFISSAKVWISSAKVWISSVKHDHLQCQIKCSPPAQNAFVTSDKHVHRQCDLYLKVSSRDYLVASDEHVRLQVHVVSANHLKICQCSNLVTCRTSIRVSDSSELKLTLARSPICLFPPLVRMSLKSKHEACIWKWHDKVLSFIAF